jgi:hypothetical protein
MSVLVGIAALEAIIHPGPRPILNLRTGPRHLPFNLVLSNGGTVFRHVVLVVHLGSPV